MILTYLDEKNERGLRARMSFNARHARANMLILEWNILQTRKNYNEKYDSGV